MLHAPRDGAWLSTANSVTALVAARSPHVVHMALHNMPLDAAKYHALLGMRACIISSADEPASVLELADRVLSAGASATLVVPLPRSGAAASDDDALNLLLRIQRMGFPRLMAAMGFAWGTPGQYGTGNRQRIDFKHVRADDVETLTLALTDADLLLLHTPRGTRQASKRESAGDLTGAAEPVVPAGLPLPLGERRARFSMHRLTFSFVLRRLRDLHQPLHRDSQGGSVRWAWLRSDDACAEGMDASGDRC